MRRFLVLLSFFLASDLAFAQPLSMQAVAISGITGTTYSNPIDLRDATMYSLEAVVDVNTPAAATFDTGTYEIQTLTFASKASTAHQDLVIVSAQSGSSFALALTKPVAEVDTLNFPTKANAVDGDYVKIFDGSAVGWAVALDPTGLAAHTPTGAVWTALSAGKKSYCDVSAATTAAQVATAAKTCLNALTGFTAAITASDGAADGHLSLTMAVKAPVTDPVPHNREDTADPTKVLTFSPVAQAGQYKLQFNGGTKTAFIAWDAANSAVQSALRLVTGMEQVTVSGDHTAGYTITYIGIDGTPTLAVTDSTLAIAVTSELQTVLWHSTTAPVSGHYKLQYGATKSTFINWDATAADVQTSLRTITALASVTVADFSPVFPDDSAGFNVTFTGVVGDASLLIVTDDTMVDSNSDPVTPAVTEVTPGTSNPSTGSLADGTPGSAAGTITGVETTPGVASVGPSGTLWSAVASARKSACDITAATTAAQVAAAAELCFNALTGFTAAITTDDTAADGTMLLTQIVPGATTNPVPKNAAESGAGSILGVETTPGVATEVSISGDSATIPTHGFYTGLKGRLTTTGTLPAGLSTGVDYFTVVVDSDTVQFADSLAHALAGTVVDITGYGSTAGVHTFTPTALAGATVKVQKSNGTKGEVEGGTASWDDVASATSITADATIWFEKDRPTYRWIRYAYTLTAGSMSTVNYVTVKGI